MITRIVKMTFQDGKQEAFEHIFDSTRAGILNFTGCLSVELHKNLENPSIYFTISRWTSAAALENYRSSEFFRKTWSQVKPMFAAGAEAWSLHPVDNASM